VKISAAKLGVPGHKWTEEEKKAKSIAMKNRTPEQLERVRKGIILSWSNPNRLTPEARKNLSDAAKARWAARTPEERSAITQKSARTTAQRPKVKKPLFVPPIRVNLLENPPTGAALAALKISIAAKVRWSRLTPEERSAIAQKREEHLSEETRIARSQRAKDQWSNKPLEERAALQLAAQAAIREKKPAKKPKTDTQLAKSKRAKEAWERKTPEEKEAVMANLALRHKSKVTQ
jgi:hypothetical protein